MGPSDIMRTGMRHKSIFLALSKDFTSLSTNEPQGNGWPTERPSEKIGIFVQLVSLALQAEMGNCMEVSCRWCIVGLPFFKWLRMLLVLYNYCIHFLWQILSTQITYNLISWKVAKYLSKTNFVWSCSYSINKSCARMTRVSVLFSLQVYCLLHVLDLFSSSLYNEFLTLLYQRRFLNILE